MANSNGNHEVPTDSNNSRNPLFRDLAADEEQEVSEIESLCLNCYKQVNSLTKEFIWSSEMLSKLTWLQ